MNHGHILCVALPSTDSEPPVVPAVVPKAGVKKADTTCQNERSCTKSGLKAANKLDEPPAKETYMLHAYIWWYTVCVRSSDPFYTITYYIELVTTSWTDGTYKNYLIIIYHNNHLLYKYLYDIVLVILDRKIFLLPLFYWNDNFEEKNVRTLERQGFEAPSTEGGTPTDLTAFRKSLLDQRLVLYHPCTPPSLTLSLSLSLTHALSIFLSLSLLSSSPLSISLNL